MTRIFLSPPDMAGVVADSERESGWDHVCGGPLAHGAVSGAVAAERPSGPADAMRLGIAVLAFEAESTIEVVLERLSAALGPHPCTLLVSDDCSSDRTVAVARRWALENRPLDVRVASNTTNRGYGGNQKVAIAWARRQALDVLVLLHGDLQHDPDDIASLLAPLEAGTAEAVFGSRTAIPGAARQGGMPRHRYYANRVLTAMQNRLANTRFSEWHSGYRAYRVDALDRVDLDGLPDWFDFDCAMTHELLEIGKRIQEVPCTTRYADEVSRVPLVRYGIRIVNMSWGRWMSVRRRRSQVLEVVGGS